MKQKIGIAILCLSLIIMPMLFTGCFDTAHHTKVTVIAYQTEVNNTYDGEYYIFFMERYLLAQASTHQKSARNSIEYNFSLKNGDWFLHLDKEKLLTYDGNPPDIGFQTTDSTDFVLIIILIPQGGNADDVHTDDITVMGAKTISI